MIYEKVLNNPEKFDFNIETLGVPNHPNPIKKNEYIADNERIAFSSQVLNILQQIESCEQLPSFEKAGIREKLFHEPKKTKAAIITCGGLCPGLNNVIKGLVNVLELEYGIQDIIGIRYGYLGLSKKSRHEPINLKLENIDQIHKQGGTILGSSRGNQDPADMVDQLVSKGVNVLFCIGGDGTLKGANAIAEEVKKRRLLISVIGIPKTIDNDLSFVEKTFGFETSVQIASDIITSAHTEAICAENGIGIVKLMGRDSGFISASATLANSVVDFCLVPETYFQLEGKGGLFRALEKRLKEHQYSVIVVAEGAGQHLFLNAPERKDISGNLIKEDIGLFLKQQLEGHFRAKDQDISVKYFDPSYHIRSVPANASDAIFCYQLAAHAVHAGMSGKTNMVIGHWNNFFTHVPIDLATSERRMIDLDSVLWKGVLSTTQQAEALK
jgi:6-phosphofructokinase 1